MGYSLSNTGRGKCRERPSETGHKLTVRFNRVMDKVVVVPHRCRRLSMWSPVVGHYGTFRKYALGRKTPGAGFESL